MHLWHRSVELNVPQSGRGSVTVSGLSFGLSEYTASAALGRSHVSHRHGIVDIAGMPGRLWECRGASSWRRWR